jgi:uncharacterized alkaline shock family protein YloU
METNINNEIGSIHISEEVIAMIAGAAANEAYGIVGMTTKAGKKGLTSILQKENMSKGVEVRFEEEEIYIDLYVIIQFGTKISVVAKNTIDKVKYNVETQTGLKVAKVNLNIEGIKVQS